MKRGFTLVELVVVAAVVGLLIGILMPQLGGAVRAAQRTRCLSNLGQLGQALLTYMDQENQGIFPVCPGYHPKWNNPNYVEVFQMLLDGGYTDAPRPRPGPDGQMVTSPAFTCPRDHRLAPAFGYSYEYPPGTLMAYVWQPDVPLRAEAVPVTRFYEQWPTDMEIFMDALGFHPESPWTEDEGGKKNAVYFDGHADWNHPAAVWKPHITAMQN